MNLIMRLAEEPRLAVRAAISQGLRAGSKNEKVFREAGVAGRRLAARYEHHAPEHSNVANSSSRPS